ncbi:MAG TPA: hypothetical protein VHD76_02495 [Bryobacteraceae bacterium]|nr:hypothetical protein [Bryobacteraceae bacterium]
MHTVTFLRVQCGLRRFWASTLVLLLSISLLAPSLWASGAAGDLPACCRRDGKHACGMPDAGGGMSAPGSAFRASRCPAFPAVQAMPVHASPATTALRPAAVPFPPDSRFLQKGEAPRCQSVFTRSHATRGPPVVVL